MSQIYNQFTQPATLLITGEFIDSREAPDDPTFQKNFYCVPEQDHPDFYQTHEAVFLPPEEGEIFEEDFLWTTIVPENKSLIKEQKPSELDLFRKNLASVNVQESNEDPWELSDEELADIGGLKVSPPRSPVTDLKEENEKRKVLPNSGNKAPLELPTWVCEGVFPEPQHLIPPSSFSSSQLAETGILFSQQEEDTLSAVTHHNHLGPLQRTRRSSFQRLKHFEAQNANLKWGRLSHFSFAEESEKTTPAVIKLKGSIGSESPPPSTLKKLSLEQSFYNSKILIEKEKLSKATEALQLIQKGTRDLVLPNNGRPLSSFEVPMPKKKEYRPSGLSQVNLSPRGHAMLLPLAKPKSDSP